MSYQIHRLSATVDTLIKSTTIIYISRKRGRTLLKSCEEREWANSPSSNNRNLFRDRK